MDTASNAAFLTWRERAGALAATPIAVLYGGASTEREVSLESGRAILASLSEPGTGPTSALAPELLPIEIGSDSRWRLDGRALAPADALARVPRETLFLLALHGGAGEDGRIQAFLEVAGHAFTGPGHACAALCMHKGRTRLAASEAGVRVAPGFFAPRRALEREIEALVARAAALPSDVAFVKHATGGSSVLVFRATSPSEVRRALEEIRSAGGEAVVEAAVTGLEVSCGVLGDGASAAPLPVVEILPRGSSAFFDYAEKYSAEGALERCPAEALDAAGERDVQAAAVAAWAAVGGEGYGRVDFIVPGPAPGAPAPGAVPVLLEVNTLPGFTPRSLLPREALAAGIGYRELCFEVLARGLAAYERRRAPSERDAG